MRNRTPHLAAAAVAVCLVALSCSKSNQRATQTIPSNSSEPTIDLKVKWTPGKKVVLRLAISSTSQMENPKTKKPIAQVTDMSWDYAINTLKQRDDGGHEVELEFVATKMESKVGDRVYLSFDSHDASKETSDPITPALRKLVGAKLNYTFGPDNKLEKLGGYDDFMVRIARGSKNSEMLKSMFNEDSLKMLCKWADGLPDHPVRPGDTWKNSTEMRVYGMAKIFIDGNFTFNGWEDRNGRKCAKLDFDGKITGKGDDQAPFTIEKGKVHGTSWFDPEQGMLIGSDSDESMTVKIHQRGNTMSQLITQNVTMQLVE